MQNDVLFAILMTLLARPATAPELAEKYELSVRSVYRYLDTLEAAGIPLLRKPGRNGGYCLDSAHFIDKTYFSDAEYRYLISLSESAGLGSRVADSVAEKLAALARMRASDGYRIAPNNLVIDTEGWLGGETVREVHSAVEDCAALAIAYLDSDYRETERVVYPHTLVLKGGGWYVYAYCTLRSDWRLFALSRIVRYDRTGETFRKMPYDLERVPWRTVPTDGGEQIELLFDEAARPALCDWLGAAVPTGGDRACVRLPITRSLVSRLLSFGAHVTVLSPESLRAELRDALDEARARYQCE